MTVFDSTLVDRVKAETRQVDWLRLFLTVLAGVFYTVGWVAAKMFNLLLRAGRALGWVAAAVRLGWREGRRAATVQT